MPRPGRKGFTRLFPFVPKDLDLPVRKDDSHIVAGYVLQGVPWDPNPISSAENPTGYKDYVFSDGAYEIYRPSGSKIVCLKSLRVRPTSLQLVFTLV